ncbi:MAG: hypothetical protein ABIR62_08380 [Dokdonella sp.]|uniref:DUF7933 domain-containing protein n=1 Tax=Dokdonella sp. TaxID=2291710 RepID=UPI0032673051
MLIAFPALLAAFAAHADVGVNKSFNPIAVSTGQVSSLTISLLNSNSTAATGTTLTDTLPPGVIIATPPNASTTCAPGTVGAVAGGASVTLTNGTVPASAGGPGQCVIVVDVVSSTSGSYINTVPVGAVTSSQGSNAQNAQATLTVVALAPVAGSKAFNPGNVHGNGAVSTLTITLPNSNGVPLTGVSITDTLPSQLAVASIPNLSTTCVPGTPASTATSVSLSGATIPASGSCTLSVDVVAKDPTSFFDANATNTVPAGALTSDQGVTNALFSNTVRVQTGAQVSKGFAPSPITSGGTTTLSIFFRNFNATALAPITLTDTLPAGMTAVGPAATTCVGGTASFTAGSVSITGGSLAAAAAGIGSTTCTLTVIVTATNATLNPIGLINTIPAGNFSGIQYPSSTATLTVNPPSNIVGSKSFAGALLQTGVMTMTVTLTNVTATPASITAFTDDLATMGAGFTVAAAPPASTTCVGGIVNAPAGGTLITMSSGVIPANGSCTIVVPVQVGPNAPTGVRTNTIAANAVVTSQGNNVLPITGTANIARALDLAKSFAPGTVFAGGNSRLTITFTRRAGASALTGLSVTDTLPAGHVIATPPTASTTCGGTVTATAGSNSVALSGGALGGGASSTSCVVQVDVKTPSGSAGTATNTIPANAVTTTEGVTTTAATATIARVTSSVSLSKGFSPDTVVIGGTSTLSVGILNTNPGAVSLTGVGITDSLPLGMLVATPPVATFSGPGCSGGTLTAVAGSTSVQLTGATVSANAACLIKLNVVAMAAGNLINTLPAGAVTNTQGVSNLSPVSATLASTGTANLAITKTDGRVQAIAGSSVTYTIVASNAGPNSVAGANVVDNPPAGVTFTSWTCTASAGSGCPASGSGPISALVSLLNGGTATFLVDALISPAATGTISNTATLVTPGSVVDPDTSNNTATDIDTLVREADLTISKTDGSTTALPGGAIVYTIVATNAGPSVATGAVITDTLPATITGATWTAAYAGGATGPATGTGNISATVTIPVGATATFTLSGTVSSTATGSLSNTATIAPPAGTTDPTPADNSATDTDTLDPSANLGITKTDGSATYTPGSAISYTLVASNAGPSAVTGATVTDTIPAAITGATWTATYAGGATGPANGSGNIAATVNVPVGATVTFTVGGTVSAAATGNLVNTATIAPPAGTIDPVTTDNSATDTDTASSSADVVALKTGPASVGLGGALSYTVVVSNSGPSNANGATFSDPLPAGITAVTATCGTPTGGAACGAVNVAGSTVTSTITTLPNGGSVTFTINGTAPLTGASISNTATANPPAGTTDPTPANNTSTVATTLLPAQLTVTKTATPNPFVVGQPAEYTITVKNTGTGTSNDPITVADTLPTGITLAGFAGSNWTCTGTTTLSCTFSGTLAPNAIATLTLTVDVAASATNASNAATATGGGDPTCSLATPPARCTGTVTVPVAASADIAVTKTVDNATPNVGQNVIFTITATNNGPNNATGVAITDALPSGLAFVSATPSQGTFTSSTGLWTVGALINGSSATLQVTAKVLVTGALTNTAIKTAGDQFDPDTSNNSASAIINGQPSADLQVQKTVDNAVPNLGTNVTFTITLTNAGPNDATGVVISDPLPLGLNFVSATPSQGTYDDVTGLWAVGAVGQGTSQTLTLVATTTLPGDITNTASVSASNQFDPNTANNSGGATINGQSADLQVVKTVNDANPIRGDTVTFTITATNNGPSNATGVAITDVLPAGLAYVSSTTSQGTYANGTGIWTVGNLAATGAGATATLTIVATVNTDSGFTNTAAVSAAGQPDPNPANNSSSVVITPVASSDLSITKTDNATTAIPGTAITYTIVATNAGPSTATGATVADTLPASITGATWTAVYSAGASGPASGTGSINATVTIPANGTATFTLTGTISATATGTLTNTATVAAPAGTTDPTPGNNSATDIDTLVPTANIGVVKNGPASVVAGSAISYSVVVTNAGQSAANGTTFTDVVPTSITGVSATCGSPTTGAACGAVNVAGNTVTSTITTLPSAGSVTFTISGIAPPNGTSLSNTASAVPPTGVTDPDPTDNSSTVSTTVAASADLSIVKTGPATVESGAPISYTLLIANAGPSAADGATYSDTVPAGITGVIATCGSPLGGAACANPGVTGNTVSGSVPALPSGGSVTITISGNAPFGTQTVNNTATVTAPTGVADPNVANNTSSASTTIGGAADIALIKTVNNAAPNVGDTVVFTITATNNGPNDASGVAVTDSLPVGLGFVSATPSQGTYTSASGLWTIGAIANGDSVTLTITASVDLPGSRTNTVAVSAADQPDPDTSNNNAGASVGAGATADIGIAKSVDNSGPNVGDSVTYTLTVTNHGPNDATGIEATDHLPTGTTFVNALPSQGAYDPVGGVWTIGALANGASATLTITVDVTAAGSITNTATLTHEDQFDPVGANNQAGTTLNGQQADLAVTKTIDNATPDVGDTVTFTVTVHNNGPSAATNVALTDQLPAGLAYVSSVASQGTYVAANGIWTVGSLSAAGPTSSATLTVVATVTEAGAMVNTASVSASDQPDPNTTNNSGSAPLNGSPLANLAVDKSGPASVTPGNNVVYAVVITNNGPSDATNVIVSDPTPAGLTFVGNSGACVTAYPCSIAALANGASATITTTYAVPANYTGANPITNTASVTSDTPDPDTTDNQSSAQTGVGAGSADVSIVKSGPATVAAGASISYQLAIVNNGPSPANGATYTDNVPSGITAISASCGGASGGASCSTQPVVTGNTVSGTVGSLPSGGGVVITITGTAGTGPLTLTNTASIDPPAGVNDPDTDNNSSTVTTAIGASSANLSVQKLGPASVSPGANVTYTLTVTNAGPDTAINAVLNDPTPAGLTFVSASTPCAAGFPCVLGDIVSGGSTIVMITFSVSLDAMGTIANTATIGSDTPDPVDINNVSTVTSTVIPVAGISADLRVTKSGPANATAGSTIGYSITIANQGPDAVPDAVLTDPTPAGLTYVSASAPCAGGFPCALGALASGASTVVTVRYTIDAGFTGTVTNIASVNSATIPDPTPDNNASVATTAVIGGPPAITQTPVPVDARWMLMLLAALLVLVAAPRAMRSR